MANRATTTLLAALLGLQCFSGSAMADNPMGYRLLSAEEAHALSRGGASLGLDVGRAERVSSNGLTFDLLRIKAVQRGGPGATAGLKVGDEIIAVDGRVFPTVAAFASYVGSVSRGGEISMDYIPASGGPQQAQRLVVKLGGKDGSTSAEPSKAPSNGLSVGDKIAIGAGAAALIGCYEYGCISHLREHLENRAR